MTRPTKAQREHRRLEETAYHEAGHAVVAIELGRGFKHVSIEPKEDSLGRVSPDKHPDSFRPDLDLERRGVARIERDILILFAGLAAVGRLRGRNGWDGACMDTKMAIDLAGYLFDGRLLEKYLEYMIERSRCLVTSPRYWIQVEALAAELLERRTLSARDARAVCHGALENRTRLQELFRAASEEEERDRRALEKLDAAAV